MDQNDQVFYEQYYSSQAGNGLDYYSGRNYMPRQYGNGIGNFLRPLGRMLTPLLKKGAKSVGRTLMNTGVDIVKDLIDGRNIKETAGVRFKEAGKSFLGDLTSGFAPAQENSQTEGESKRVGASSSAGKKRKRKATKRPAKPRKRNIFI